MGDNGGEPAVAGARGHRRWVRLTHWVIAFSILTLGVSGVFIFAVHPRLYWGEVGNDLVPAILEIPISNNYRPDEYVRTVDFPGVNPTAFSANRTYDTELFNENGWGRSLHFLAAWFLLVTVAGYLLAGSLSGHVKRNLLPRLRDLTPRSIGQDIRAHTDMSSTTTGAGAPYGIVQRCAYVGVVFVAVPVMIVTGLTMSPAITAAVPSLLDLFGGYQSARTIHFFGFTAIMLFLIVHVVMVLLTGFRRQLRAMTIGG